MSRYLELAAVLGVALLGFILLRERPKYAAVIWLATVCFVPVWEGVTVRIFLFPTIVAAVFVLLTLLPVRVRAINMADVAMAFFLLVSLAPLVVGGASGPYLSVLLTQWLVAFSLGRVLPLKVDVRWIYGLVAVMFTGVAVLALIEYATQQNFFVGLRANNRLYSTWSPILSRGGVARVEGAFGHPIALGVCLAMALPMIFASRFRTWLRMAMAVVVALAIVPTFSRGAMVCGGLAIAISLLFVRQGLSAKARTLSLLTLGGAALAAVPLVVSTFAEAGAEASRSAGYRTDLLSLLPKMSILGFSTSAARNANGDLFFANYRSIDSAALLLGLTFGWLALVVAGVLVAAGVVKVLLGHADAATAAVVAAVPAVATVAFITQYGMFFWFLAGMAVCAQAQRRSSGQEPDADSDTAGHGAESEAGLGGADGIVRSAAPSTGRRQAPECGRPAGAVLISGGGPDQHGGCDRQGRWRGACGRKAGGMQWQK